MFFRVFRAFSAHSVVPAELAETRGKARGKRGKTRGMRNGEFRALPRVAPYSATRGKSRCLSLPFFPDGSFPNCSHSFKRFKGRECKKEHLALLLNILYALESYVSGHKSMK